MTINKDIKVALLSIIAIVAMVLAYTFMKGTLFHRGNPEYNALFSNVDKLKKSDKIYLNGVIVGTVVKMEFEDITHPDKIKLTFNADKGLNIPKDSKIQIISTSLMGNMGLNLIYGTSEKYLNPDDYLLGLEENGIMQKLGENFSPLAASSDSLIRNVNTLFNRNQNENFYITLNELNKTLSSVSRTLDNMNTMVAVNQKPIHKSMENFASITTNLANNQDELNQTIKNFKEMSVKANKTDLEGMVKKVNTSVNEMNILLSEINSGKGSLGLLMKDPELYQNLNTTVSNANSLMIDLKANPKRYVGFSLFGGKK